MSLPMPTASCKIANSHRARFAPSGTATGPIAREKYPRARPSHRTAPPPSVGLQHFWRSESPCRHKGRSERNAQFCFGLRALGFIRNLAYRLERAPQMGDCLLVGTAAQGLVGGALMVRDCVKLAAALEVLGQLRRDRVQPISPRGLEPMADTRMARATACCRHPFVHKFAVEVMPKSIEFCPRAIRPSGCTRLDDEHTLPCKARACPFNLQSIGPQRGCNRGGCNVARRRSLHSAARSRTRRADRSADR